MTFNNKYYAGNLYKEDGEWVVYIFSFEARTFKRDWCRYFGAKRDALRYFNQYKQYQ